MPFLYAPHQIGRRKAKFKCIGGIETDVGTTRVHTFLSSGTFTVLSGEGDIDALMVAGGGGYPNVSYNYGCGAGGMMVSTGNTVSKGTFTVTVGAGGVNGNGASSTISDTNGTSIGSTQVTRVPDTHSWWGNNNDFDTATAGRIKNNGNQNTDPVAMHTQWALGAGNFDVSFTVTNRTGLSWGLYDIDEHATFRPSQNTGPNRASGHDHLWGNVDAMTVSYWHDGGNRESPGLAQYDRAQYGAHNDNTNSDGTGGPANNTRLYSTGAIANGDNVKYERRNGEIKMYVNNSLAYTYPETFNGVMRFMVSSNALSSNGMDGGAAYVSEMTNISLTYQNVAQGGGGGEAGQRSGGSGQGGLDGTWGEGTAGQGNDGGNGARSNEGAALGGGGGAGAVGGAASPPPRRNPGVPAGGAGGIGLENNYRTGSNVFYAGGGAGNASSEGQNYAYDPPAQGGGGSGAGSSGAGTANTGGGGAGGNGGSGIVVIRYEKNQ